MDLNEISVFVKVVQLGSFTQAARQLGMPNSTVSARVASLERRLGLILLRRTTRQLHLTDVGQAYFRRCLNGLEEIARAEVELVSSQSEPQGKLRIAAPVELGSNILPPIMADFSKRYPKVDIETVLTDRVVDLLSDGIDLAIRMGQLRDSSLMAKKLGSVSSGLFASPLYIRKSASLENPKQLSQHQLLQFTPFGKTSWELTNKKTAVKIAVPGRILANDLNMLKAMAVSGAGIVLLPSFLCLTEIKEGRLVHLLPEWRTGVAPVHFVHSGQKFPAPSLKLFIQTASVALQAVFRNLEAELTA
jgi:DNA-binding transcriptional LysR family regulator